MTKRKSFLLAIALLCSLLFSLSSGEAQIGAALPAATFTVNNAGDGSDATPGDGVCETAAGNGICTLRAAIEEANATSGADTILFEAGLNAIVPNNVLPSLDDTSGGTTIRGNPNWIFGALAGTGYDVNGFTLLSNDNRIQGMWITNFYNAGVEVQGNNNIIGTDGDGVDDASEGNLISSNGRFGVAIENASGNWLAGNLIGLTDDGTGAAGNGDDGVLIHSGAHTNLVGTNGDGTSDVLERNVISGNGRAGVFLGSADANMVAGNYIGTNAAGDAALLNDWHGMYIDDSANNRIGTDGDGVADNLEGNLISGNDAFGIYLSGSSDSIIAGNYVGTNAAGDAAIPNGSRGMFIQASANNRIGTDADGTSDDLERNLVSGNTGTGIQIDYVGTEGNVIAGNYIGTNAAGDAALPNTGSGVTVQGCANNRIGGTAVAERNLISGNAMDGVNIYSGTTNTLVQGNYIGTDASGSGSLGNGGYGVDLINGVIGNTIGGTASGAANIIAYNGQAGIRVYMHDDTLASYDNSLRGNLIYANIELSIDLQPEEGVTSNDPGDGDEGANHLQNFPVLSSAESDSSQIIIVGALNSTANTSFAVDFYANSACNPSGYGEGEIYLGSNTVSTNASGDVNFTAAFSSVVPEGYFVTATATGPDGNTSEFSLCQGVTALEPQLLIAIMNGAGSGRISSTPAGISCPGDCDELYDYDTLVTLTASADDGSIFTGWSGSGCSGTGDCTVTMVVEKSVTATFDLVPPEHYGLVVSLSGGGDGTVTGSGIDCFNGSGADCTETFIEGAIVSLTASPNAGSIFSGWSGAGCSGVGACVVTMTEPQLVSAIFTLEEAEFKIFLPLLTR